MIIKNIRTKIVTLLTLLVILIVGFSIPAYADDYTTVPPHISIIKTYKSISVTPEFSCWFERRFVRYLTTSWAYSDKYTWNQSQTASLSFGGNLTLEMTKAVKTQLSLTSSKSYTFGVSTSIPADSSRLSKLAFDCNFKCQNVAVKETLTTYFANYKVITTSKTTRDVYYEPSENSYLYVKYQ